LWIRLSEIQVLIVFYLDNYLLRFTQMPSRVTQNTMRCISHYLDWTIEFQFCGLVPKDFMLVSDTQDYSTNRALYLSLPGLYILLLTHFVFKDEVINQANNNINRW